MSKPYYQDDYVTLYHGDCIALADWWLDADVLVTDPPYGMAFVSNASKRGKGASIAGDESTDARDRVLAAWGSKPALTFGTWKAHRPDGTRLVLTWDKGPSVGSGDITMPWGLSTEEVYVTGEWPPIKPGGRKREGGTPSRVSSVIRVDNFNTQSSDRPSHPTPKPIPLMERLIERCPPGVIADPFAGSGATLIAAKNLRRQVVGVELEERYCEIIAKRLSQDVLDLEWTA